MTAFISTPDPNISPDAIRASDRPDLGRAIIWLSPAMHVQLADEMTARKLAMAFAEAAAMLAAQAAANAGAPCGTPLAHRTGGCTCARSLDDGTGHCRDCGTPLAGDGSHISARSGAHIPAQPQEVTQ
jgi:hypothetical protein